jgi:large subunit ribosomal protein L35
MMAIKAKTHRSASKRLKVTGTGKIMRKSPGKGHLLGDKTASRKRRLGMDKALQDGTQKRIAKLLPNR